MLFSLVIFAYHRAVVSSFIFWRVIQKSGKDLEFIYIPWGIGIAHLPVNIQFSKFTSNFTSKFTTQQPYPTLACSFNFSLLNISRWDQLSWRNFLVLQFYHFSRWETIFRVDRLLFVQGPTFMMEPFSLIFLHNFTFYTVSLPLFACTSLLSWLISQTTLTSTVYANFSATLQKYLEQLWLFHHWMYTFSSSTQPRHPSESHKIYSYKSQQ